MKVVVTGAAGFIGSHLTDALLSRGDEVVGVDSFAPNYPREIKERNLEGARASDRFELIEGDLSQLDLTSLCSGADAVVHLVALTDARAGEEEWPEYQRINVELPRRVVAAAGEAGVGLVVLASSSAVYGGARDDGSPSAESDQPAPIGPYGRSKAEMEQTALASAGTGISVVCLRFFTVFGSRQRPDMLCARAIAAASGGPALPLLGDGSQRRAWVHVNDAVSAIVATLDSPSLSPDSVINIGAEETHEVRELIERISQLIGSDVAIDRLDEHPADPAATIADISLAATLLGWRPQVSLHEGLEEQVAWARGL